MRLAFAFKSGLAPALSLIGMVCAGSALAESPKPALQPPPQALPSYADLADLADNSTLVLKAKIRKVAEVEPARAIGVRPGWARLYVEAVTENLLTGPAAVGSALRYLVDVKRDARGKLPKLSKQSVLLFARYVPARPGIVPTGDIQLIAPDAQLIWDVTTDSLLRMILVEIFAPGAPGRISRVHEAIYVPGTLAAQGETQIFLATPDGEPAAITVLHHPGMPTHWGVSFSELMSTTGVPPGRNTLTWYRLACFLPPTLQAGVNVSTTPEDRAQADTDYRRVMTDLGPCPRTRR